MNADTRDSMFESLTIVDFLRRRAIQDGSRHLYSWLDDTGREVERWTLDDLDHRARRISGRLRATAAPGSRALLIFPPGLAFAAAFFGCLYAGLIAVPANLPRWRRTDQRLRAITRDARPELLLSTTQFVARKAAYIAANPELDDLTWLAIDGSEATVEPDPYPDLPVHRPQAGDIAFLQYTSGSTADPKGVIVTHGNLMANQAMIAEALGANADTVYVDWLPLYHDMGLIGPLISAVYLGCRSYHMAPTAFMQRPIRWLEAMSRYRCTFTAAPNFAYDLCVNSTTAEERQRLDFSSLQAALNAAEPVRVESLERFIAAFEPCGFLPEMFAPTYGLAEATLFVTGGKVRDGLVVRYFDKATLATGRAIPALPGASGSRALAGCGPAGDQWGIRIVDPATCLERPPGQVGEIWVTGPHVSPGYWRKPEQTAATFQQHIAPTAEGPYLRTGDLGFTFDGQLFISGRMKELIIIRGRNHFPQDIEHTVARSHAALRPGCAAAFGLDSGSEEMMVVVQEVKREARHKMDANQITEAVRRAVAGEHGLTLDGLVLVKPLSVPKTTSGKTRRLATREAFLDGTLDVLAQWLSDRLTGEEDDSTGEGMSGAVPAFRLADDPQVNAAQIQAWMQRRLNHLAEMGDNTLDLTRSFNDYGLDSLTSIRLAGELAEWLGQPLELAVLWELPTVGALVDHLVAQLHQPPAGASPPADARAQEKPISPQEAERLLSSIEELSEAELDALLAALDSLSPPSNS